MSHRIVAPAGLGALVREAERDGQVVHVVDAGRDKASTLAAFARALDLPAWFGHNLDALADALRDLADDEGRPILLLWDHPERLRLHDPAAHIGVLSVLDDVASDRDDLTVALVDR